METLSGFRECLTPNFIKAAISEFLATAILIIAGCGSVVTMDAGKPLSTLTTALTFAMTVTFIVYTFSHASGAHINPVVTLGFLVTGHITVAKVIAYIVAQCAGATVGSLVLWYIVPASWRGTFATTVFHEDITLAQGFAVEAVSTFFLMLGVLASGDTHRTDHGGSTSLAVGLIVFMQGAWAGKLTGCSMNPARTLGPAIFSGTWDNHWVYWVAPAFGSILGSLLYQHMLAQATSDNSGNIQFAPATNSSEKDSGDKRLTETSPALERLSTIRNLKKGFNNPVLELSYP